MFVTSHIRVATRIMNHTSGDIKVLNRFFFCLGSITPDLIMMLPKHQVIESLRKIRVYLFMIHKSRCNSLINAWRLGVVLHYVCDYFCRPHNDAKLLHGRVHFAYEFELAKRVKRFYDLNSLEICNLTDYQYVKALLNEHMGYIDNLIHDKITDDVEEAFLMGLGLIKSHSYALVKNGG